MVAPCGHLTLLTFQPQPTASFCCIRKFVDLLLPSDAHKKPNGGTNYKTSVAHPYIPASPLGFSDEVGIPQPLLLECLTDGILIFVCKVSAQVGHCKEEPLASTLAFEKATAEQQTDSLAKLLWTQSTCELKCSPGCCLLSLCYSPGWVLDLSELLVNSGGRFFRFLASTNVHGGSLYCVQSVSTTCLATFLHGFASALTLALCIYNRSWKWFVPWPSFMGRFMLPCVELNFLPHCERDASFEGDKG